MDEYRDKPVRAFVLLMTMIGFTLYIAVKVLKDMGTPDDKAKSLIKSSVKMALDHWYGEK